jgi:hypothetical protein
LLSRTIVFAGWIDIEEEILIHVIAFLALQVAPQATAPQEYFQQSVAYTMEARLDEVEDLLVGGGVMQYHNNATTSLNELYFNLSLNAFRPNSTWATTEAREDYDFQNLNEIDAGFHHMTSMKLDGVTLAPEYPHAPDSTVVRYSLPHPLAANESLSVEFTWTARPSTLCRRQCRQGRSYDFAHWYPRVAVFDHTGWATRPLYPQGEFYGEFASYNVTLDVAADQVIGATGVPVSGDPGWALTALDSIPESQYRREFYGSPKNVISPGLLVGEPEAGRKRVNWIADDVHHFAWSTSPDYQYESGTLGDISIHVLYRPGDLEWDLGAAARRTERALGWLQDLFGPYPWPQLTNLHRLEGGGTEFPMVLMDGSASQGLITHEGAHQYAHGVFGNNEWREGWLDEGMASFLTGWFNEEHGVADPWSGLMVGIGRMTASGLVAPISTEAAEFPDFRTYGLMTYSLPQAVLYMLKNHLGDQAFRQGLRAYYQAKRLQHVTEADFRHAMEQSSGEDLGWFFDQWFHTTGTLDYGVGAVSQEQSETGWITSITIERLGDNWMPVTVRVGHEDRRLTSQDAVQIVEFLSLDRPDSVTLDPDVLLIDSDRSNNTTIIPESN